MIVFAVVVAYYPNPETLARLAQAIGADGANVVVVDNTPSPTDLPLPGECTVLRLGDNMGIARAQNVGIAHARERGAEVIVFFDQDSAIDSAFVPKLVSSLDAGRPGVVGAVYFDETLGFEGASYKLTPRGYPKQVRTGAAGEPYPVDVRISSGSAATAVTFDVAGLMDEDFFIDYVDIEWCLRARSKGVPIRVDPGVSMKHSIGKLSVDVGPLKVFVDGPVRTYYRVRNAFLLARKPSVPLLFSAKEITSELVHHFLQLFVADRRVERLGAYLLGIRHGLAGVAGRKPDRVATAASTPSSPSGTQP